LIDTQSTPRYARAEEADPICALEHFLPNPDISPRLAHRLEESEMILL
jgi:hypothetical protein